MIEIKDFFVKENEIEHIPDEAYNDINGVLEDINAFARVTYKSVYVIDYYHKDFLGVSANPLFLCGHDVKEVQRMGYNFYINQIVPEDLGLLLEANSAVFRFLKDVPSRDLCNYTVSYDFRIVNKNSKTRWLINHQMTPLRLTNSGKVWLALCVVSISTANESGNIVIIDTKSKARWVYHRTPGQWKEVPLPTLKELELDVLKLSAMGYTIEEIADKVNRSFDSVKGYRKSLLAKLGVENIIEAINFAKQYRMI